MSTEKSHYQLIARTIHILREQWPQQLSLKDLAELNQVSESHLQRVFTAFVGVSPKQFCQFLTKEHAIAQLREADSVLDSAYAAGLSSGGRLYDLMLRWEAMTPGEYRSQGENLALYCAIQPSVFGWACIAETERGVCHLSFWDTHEEAEKKRDDLREEWPLSPIKQREPRYLDLAALFSGELTSPLSVMAKGTPFQLKVWEALIKIPFGQRCSYQHVAAAIDQPSATRAVASAIGRNHLAYLIPCHRVIRATGESNQYRWGSERKALLLGWESAHKEDSACVL